MIPVIIKSAIFRNKPAKCFSLLLQDNIHLIRACIVIIKRLYKNKFRRYFSIGKTVTKNIISKSFIFRYSLLVFTLAKNMIIVDAC